MTWVDVADDYLPDIAPTGFTSPSRKARWKPSNANVNRINGTVIKWNNERGFGFVRRHDGGADLFVHASDLRRSGIESLSYGERISFEEGEGKDGKKMAVNIEELYQ